MAPSPRERILPRHFGPAALVVVAVVLFAGIQINSIHSEATNSVFNDASTVADALSYNEMLAAWNGNGPNPELTAEVALQDMVPGSNPVWKAGDAFVMSYPVKTFAKTSCVYSVVAPNGGAVEMASGQCISAGLPPMTAGTIAKANQ